MVAIVTGLGKTGLQEWVIQRATAMLLICYIFVMCLFFLNTTEVTFDIWYDFIDNLFIKLLTLIAITSLVAHSWIGLWTIITDYIKYFYLRILIQILVNLLLIGYVVIGIEILWGL
jgi:succinate dehydrogenase / fumarate reductase membrane anchor subunit